MLHTIGTIPAENLLGMDMDLKSKLRSRALSIREYQKFLNRENPFAYPGSLIVGSFKNGDQLYHALRGARVEFSPNTSGYITKNLPLQKEKDKINIMVVTGRELGLLSNYTWEEIARIGGTGKHGLSLCYPDVGPIFRLKYRDQPKNEKILVAMHCAMTADRKEYIYSISCDKDYVLRIDVTSIENTYTPDTKWLFTC